MRRVFATLLLLGSFAGCTGVAPGDKVYTWNDLMLVTSYTAKDTCSCLFVMNRSQDYCLAWTQASPQVTNWTVDMNTKTVTASAAIFWGAQAHFVSPQLGCVLNQ